jgi:lipopolysaccharide transport system permease protein/teichoic acid transport system permease protein
MAEMAVEVSQPALPAPPPDAPRSFVGDVRKELAELGRYRHLLRYLVTSSLQAKHKQTLLGYLWWILDPLLMAAIYYVLVHVMLKRGGANYPIFIFSAVVTWRLFTTAVTSSITTTVSKLGMMRQVRFPRTALPLAATIAQTVRFLFGFLVLLALAAATGVLPDVHLLFLPVVLVPEVLLALGFGYALAAVNVYARDVSNLTTHLFRMWFYLSPGLYVPKVVPASVRGIYNLNPFATIFPAYRAIVLYHRVPPLAGLAWVTLGAAVVLVGGFLLFVRLQDGFTKVA